MTEIITAILLLICLILIGVQGQKLTQQQSQIEQLRESLTEYMTNMTQYVLAQNEANGAVIDSLATYSNMSSGYDKEITILHKRIDYLKKLYGYES
jgi:hypothetical protein